jgi:hypothetical protein
MLNAGRFAGSGVGHCPEIPRAWERRRAPKRHTLLTYLTRPTVYVFSGRPDKLPTPVVASRRGLRGLPAKPYAEFPRRGFAQVGYCWRIRE